MKIEEYGYVITNLGKLNKDKSNYQDFATYPLHCGLPRLKSDSLALHYAISVHGFNMITVKENNLSIHVITNIKSSQDSNNLFFYKQFMPAFFIEKTKVYQSQDHTKFIFSMLYQRINAINPYFDKGVGENHPYRELEAYCKKHFGFIDLTARTEVEAGR
jgi:hypothetical protein